MFAFLLLVQCADSRNGSGVDDDDMEFASEFADCAETNKV